MRRCIYCPIQKTREKHWVGLFQYKSFRFIIWHMSWKRNECLWAPCRVCSLYAGSCRRPQHGLLGREKNRNKKRSHSSINDILRTTCKSRIPSCTVVVAAAPATDGRLPAPTLTESSHPHLSPSTPSTQTEVFYTYHSTTTHLALLIPIKDLSFRPFLPGLPGPQLFPLRRLFARPYHSSFIVSLLSWALSSIGAASKVRIS